MYIVIMGCGRVGTRLAKVLTLDGHEIAIVDKDPTAFKRLGKTFKGQAVEGIGFDRDVLKKAGIERADAFIAVTNGDNHNVVGALVAKNKFRVPKVVARIYDPAREKLYQHLGIQTISSTAWAANKIKNLICHIELIRHLSFGNGEVEIVEGEISPQLVGRSVNDLNIPGEITVITIVRFGKAFIPTSGTVFQEKDGIQIVVETAALPKLKKMLHLG
ncbi:MAG: TrkA family potassium uptake protein [Actinobacteria bacterium]|nr:TrkA family potassium uptake protein [Actinomycetota bacterium]